MKKYDYYDKMKSDRFDERQLWIRANIFKHMFFIIAGLISLNTFLATLDVVWAKGVYPNIIILIAAIAAGTIEMIFKDVYFKDNEQRWMIVLGITYAFLFIMNISHMLAGEKFISGGTLTNVGFWMIYSMFMLSIIVSWLIKLLYDKVKNK